MDSAQKFLKSFNGDDLPLVGPYTSWLKKRIDHYQLAINKLQKSKPELQKDIRLAESLLKSQSTQCKRLKVYSGFTWYTSDEEIWRFFIRETVEVIKYDTAKRYILNSAKKVKEMSSLINKFKFEIKAKEIGIKIYKKIHLTWHNPTNINKLALSKLINEGLTQKIFKKIQNDLGNWKANRFFREFIPSNINTTLDRLFANDDLVIKFFKTFDKEALNQERGKIYSKVTEEITNYILKNDGEIDDEKIGDLINSLIKSQFPDSVNFNVSKYLDDILAANVTRDEIEKESDIFISEETEFEKGDLIADANEIVRELKKEGRINIKERGTKSYLVRKLGKLYISKYLSIGLSKKKFFEAIFDILNGELDLTKSGWSKEKMLDASNHQHLN